MSDDEYIDSEFEVSSSDEDIFIDESQETYSSRTGKGKAVDRHVHYECLGPEVLQGNYMDREIESITSVLGIKRSLATILLLHFRWNRDRIIEDYTDNQVNVLRAIGELPDPAIENKERQRRPSAPKTPPRKRFRFGNLKKPTTEIPPPPSFQPPQEEPPSNCCGVCFDDLLEGEIPRTKCGHRFCEDCWQMYLTAKIKDEGLVEIHCMSSNCKSPLEEEFIKSLVEPDCFGRWKTLVVQSYVTSRPSMCYCPFPECDQIVYCPSTPRGSSALFTRVPSVVCVNKHTFCFGCGLEGGHAPVICKIASLWLEAKEDAGSIQWINAHTKKCPKCLNSIEKNGGCNRILCRHCRYQFCWMCMQKWETHGYNDKVCNVWTEPPKSEEMNNAAVNLERWLFYYDRYNNHELSSRLDQELVEKAQEKMLEIQETSDLSWIETHFMKTAVEELTKCRHSLKWTYVMAHFLKTSNSKAIFEDIQADLEKAVEQLSQLLDEPIETVTINYLRRSILNKTAYVQKRHEILLDDVAKGLSDRTWEWTVPLE